MADFVIPDIAAALGLSCARGTDGPHPHRFLSEQVTLHQPCLVLSEQGANCFICYGAFGSLLHLMPEPSDAHVSLFRMTDCCKLTATLFLSALQTKSSSLPRQQILDVRNVVVVVSRWYGGILLGPDRFKHINNCARNILVEEGYAASAVRRSPVLK